MPRVRRPVRGSLGPPLARHPRRRGFPLLGVLPHRGRIALFRTREHRVGCRVPRDIANRRGDRRNLRLRGTPRERQETRQQRQRGRRRERRRGRQGRIPSPSRAALGWRTAGWVAQGGASLSRPLWAAGGCSGWVRPCHARGLCDPTGAAYDVVWYGMIRCGTATVRPRHNTVTVR